MTPFPMPSNRTMTQTRRHGCPISRFVLTLAVALAGAIAYPACAQQVLPAQSEIGFVSRQMGVPVAGRFSRWQAQIAFDPARPEAGQVAFAIDTASASLGAPETDAELPKPAWFDASRFPRASFQSSAIRRSGAGRYEISGKLAIKGRTRDVVVPVTLTQAGTRSIATGSFTIRRLDFHVGDGEWADPTMVANDVQVNFKLALAGMAPM